MSNQPNLFDKLKPRSLEVSGGDLVAVIRSLKERGAHISGMVSTSVSGWRITIEWPQQNILAPYERMGF
jgi:hypothetical protein